MALSSSEIKVLGDPGTVRSYLSEYDMASWIYKSLCQKIDSKYLSIGSANPVTILELANEVSAQTGARVRLPKSFEPGDIYVANSLETQKLLNVNETISWQNALERYITFSREIQKNAR
jgi:nucleoside-diphosphate-sugar epimerase